MIMELSKDGFWPINLVTFIVLQSFISFRLYQLLWTTVWKYRCLIHIWGEVARNPLWRWDDSHFTCHFWPIRDLVISPAPPMRGPGVGTAQTAPDFPFHPAPARPALWRRICRRGTLNWSGFRQNSEIYFPRSVSITRSHNKDSK